MPPYAWQLESTPRGFAGHSVTLFNGQIYDAAESRCMPIQKAYFDRCVRESKHDKDTFLRFKQVALFRPTEKLESALLRREQKKKRRLETGSSEPKKKQAIASHPPTM